MFPCTYVSLSSTAIFPFPSRELSFTFPIARSIAISPRSIKEATDRRLCVERFRVTGLTGAYYRTSTFTIECKSCDRDGHSNAFVCSRIYKSHRVGSRVNFELELNVRLLLLTCKDTRECGWFVRCNYLTKRLPRGTHNPLRNPMAD